MYEAVVVGAGPAGITVVGNLLDQRVEPILWIDTSFNGGRVNRMYREVPSNTRVALFVQFATAVAPFRKIVSNTPSRSRWDEPSASDGQTLTARDGQTEDKLAGLRELPQDKGCQLSHAADMCLMLTEGLKKTPGVHPLQTRVTEAVLDQESSTWTIKLDGDADQQRPAQEAQAKRLVLCTGSSPNSSPLPFEVPHSLLSLDLDFALSPQRLATTLSSTVPLTVAVVGASHSAVLVLRNLYRFAKTSNPKLKIKWFTRHQLRYAEFMDGWILRDNTGLKGEAAVWAKYNLEPEKLPHSDVGKYITAIEYKAGEEKEVFEQHMRDCDYYVQAIGYTRNSIPKLQTSKGETITPTFDHQTGMFNYSVDGQDGPNAAEKKLPGMFGAGIAWPERVKDPLGNVEYAVGFWKFMTFVKKVVPRWVSD